MIGKILKKLLETKNLKVSELAAMTSLQIPTINNIIQGSSAKRELIQKISLALKVDLLRYIDKKKKVINFNGIKCFFNGPIDTNRIK